MNVRSTVYCLLATVYLPAAVLAAPLVWGCGSRTFPQPPIGRSVANEVLSQDKAEPAQPAAAAEQLPPKPQPARPLPGNYSGFEPSVAADADGRLVVAAVDSSSAANPYNRIIHWRSRDQGQTWTEPVPYGPWASDYSLCDPSLQIDGKKGFYIAYLAVRRVAPHGNTGASWVAGNYFQRSDDGGATWTPPVPIEPPGDKTVFAVSPSGRRFVVVHSEAIVQSGDQGKSWHALALPGEAKEWTHAPWGLVADDRQGIAVAWIVVGPEAGTGRVVLGTTRDAGMTWTRSEVSRFHYDPQHRNPSCYVGVAMVRDGTGALHALYARPRDGDIKWDLLLRSSADFRRWSAPVSLAGGEGDCCDSCAIAASGATVHVAWIENRGKLDYVLYRRSRDGGKTWSDSLLVSRPAAVNDLITDRGGFARFHGDWVSLADDGRGTAHAVWGVAKPKKQGQGVQSTIWYAAVK